MKGLLFFVTALECSTAFCMDVVFSSLEWPKSIADITGPFGTERAYSVSEWDEISTEKAKDVLLEMIMLSWPRMSDQDKSNCFLNEEEILAFNQIPANKAKVLLAHTTETGLWMFCKKNPNLFDRIDNEWKMVFALKERIF
jgi:hypothetical protein